MLVCVCVCLSENHFGWVNLDWARVSFKGEHANKDLIAEPGWKINTHQRTHTHTYTSPPLHQQPSSDTSSHILFTPHTANNYLRYRIIPSGLRAHRDITQYTYICRSYEEFPAIRKTFTVWHLIFSCTTKQWIYWSTGTYI